MFHHACPVANESNLFVTRNQSFPFNWLVYMVSEHTVKEVIKGLLQTKLYVRDSYQNFQRKWIYFGVFDFLR